MLPTPVFTLYSLKNNQHEQKYKMHVPLKYTYLF